MVGSPGEVRPLLHIALGDMFTGSNAISTICATLLGHVKSGYGQHIGMELYEFLIALQTKIITRAFIAAPK